MSQIIKRIEFTQQILTGVDILLTKGNVEIFAFIKQLAEW